MDYFTLAYAPSYHDDLKAGKYRFDLWSATCIASPSHPTRAMVKILLDNINESKNIYLRYIDDPFSLTLKRYEGLEKFIKPYITGLGNKEKSTKPFCKGLSRRLGELNREFSSMYRKDKEQLREILSPMRSFPTQQTVVNKLFEQEAKCKPDPDESVKPSKEGRPSKAVASEFLAEINGKKLDRARDLITGERPAKGLKMLDKLANGSSYEKFEFRKSDTAWWDKQLKEMLQSINDDVNNGNFNGHLSTEDSKDNIADSVNTKSATSVPSTELADVISHPSSTTEESSSPKAENIDLEDTSTVVVIDELPTPTPSSDSNSNNDTSSDSNSSGSDNFSLPSDNGGLDIPTLVLL